MDNYNLKIIELSRSKSMLNIGVQINGPYDPAVREPKIALIFRNGQEIRRIPLNIQAYFPEEDLKTCVIFAKYAYDLRYLFYKTPVNERVTIEFEVTYGENVIQRPSFTFSSDVDVTRDMEYDIYVEDGSVIVYEKIWLVVEPKKLSVLISSLKRVSKNAVKNIWEFLLIVAVIPIIPLFAAEGILALLGCAKKAPKNTKKGVMHFINHVRWRVNNFTRRQFGLTDTKLKILKYSSNFFNLFPIKQNRVVFISNRRNDLSGNFEYIYEILKEDKKLDIRFVLDNRDSKRMSFRTAIAYGRYFATSKVVLVDDYTPLIHKLPKREGVSIIQLWHACGAFKTFGYSRIGKPGGQTQASPNHRNYDYAIVSSNEIAKFYAEGFGISLEKAVATGVPRTDIFFDKAYKENIRATFYEQYPQLKDKKIMIFAPTFRGNGKLSGSYPVNKFDVVKVYEQLKGEYAIIIKHHPFVRSRNVIPKEYQDYIIDLSDNSELNDLLFVADLLISDYSSVIFEAALLDIPMLFYAYDLQRYISGRGFYYEYEKFVPGKIVETFADAMKAIKANDFETDKIAKFKTRFFDDLDGKSSQRTVDLVYKALGKQD